jgi:hypothetical protein
MAQAPTYGAIFADAYQVHTQAIDRLEQGDIRDTSWSTPAPTTTSASSAWAWRMWMRWGRRRKKHGAPPNELPTP